jgi:hypothetical protein
VFAAGSIDMTTRPFLFGPKFVSGAPFGLFRATYMLSVDGRPRRPE